MEGFIRMARNIINWEWYTSKNEKILFFHCLLIANQSKNRWQGVEIDKGQFISSIDNLSQQTGLTIQNVRTAINNLILTGYITKYSTNKYTLFTVNFYDEWIKED